jgi:tRNA dimethylallyltransferase
VARPSDKELAAVPHHFIASHSIHDKMNAGVFEQYALEKAEQIFKQNDVLIMVGGTGLYIKAFCEGIDEMPQVPDVIRKKITVAYEQNGIAWLQEEVKRLDPQFYQVGEVQNPHRLMRALEIFKATGSSILDFRKGQKVKRDFRIIKIALSLPKPQLHENINSRVDKMMETGLIDEVRMLIPYQHINALQTVGYKELFSHYSGEITLTEAVSDIKTNTRKYAKRQLTWFKKDAEYVWFEPEINKILAHLHSV